MKVWIKRIAWGLFGIGVIVLLFMAQGSQWSNEAAEPEILIHVNGANAFLTEDELYTRLKRRGLIYEGQTKEQLNVAAIEEYIRSMTEVKQANVYSMIGKGWMIDVTVRKPIARIYNKYDETFYLDEDGVVMKASTLHTARVVVVTGYLKDRISSIPVQEIINNDTLKSIRKLDDVYRISNYVCNDPLLQSLIGQIHLKKEGDFVLIPLVGGQKIIFGAAHDDDEVREKFEKLKIFYREAIPYEGWDKYEEINLKFKRQIVCKKSEGYTEEKLN
ncbi:MAG: cell division protein FtsQ/DivIB [Flavobacteriia bacterium]|jgi:cell division protein FtsQ